MVDRWNIVGISEIPDFLSAPLPGPPPAMHVGRYRQCAPGYSEIVEGEPELDTDVRVVGNGTGEAHAYLVRGILRLGAIMWLYQSDTHTVVIVEEMDYECDSFVRDTDPIWRIRLREDFLASARAKLPVFEAMLPVGQEADTPMKLPIARCYITPEHEE